MKQSSIVLVTRAVGPWQGAQVPSFGSLVQPVRVPVSAVPQKVLVQQRPLQAPLQRPPKVQRGIRVRVPGDDDLESLPRLSNLWPPSPSQPLWPEQVGPITCFISVSFFKKNHNPIVEKRYSPPFLLATPLSLYQTLEGLFELT